MPRYYRREWDESRGDAHDAWGTSTWFFETADDGHVLRQVEVYASGKALRYDPDHLEDEYGGLSEKPLDLADFAPFETDASTFEQAWRLAEG